MRRERVFVNNYAVKNLGSEKRLTSVAVFVDGSNMQKIVLFPEWALLYVRDSEFR